MLSDKDLRAAYDKYGKESARPSEGFVDPAEFFSMIFGGEAFVDWIGEISLMKDLTATMDITLAGAEEEEEATAAAAASEGGGTANAPASAAAKDGEHPGADENTAGQSAEKKTTTTTTTTATGPTVVVEDEQQQQQQQDAERTGDAGSSEAASTPGTSTPGTSTPRSGGRTQIPLRPALMDRPSDEQRPQEEASVGEGKRKDRKSKSGLTKEQKEQLAAYERERARVRQERVDTLAQKLLDRLSVWTETDRGKDVTAAFREKIRLETEELKMESFGIDILHAIGAIYVSKGTALLRSQKFFGMGGFLSRMKDKGTLVKDTWNTISSAIEAQQSMEEMARLEQLGGDDWTEEKKSEYERRVTGKILTAAWRGSKFEIQSVLRDVCDAVLYDKKVPLAKRLQRAEALVIVGQICSNVSFLSSLSLSACGCDVPC